MADWLQLNADPKKRYTFLKPGQPGLSRQSDCLKKKELFYLIPKIYVDIMISLCYNRGMNETTQNTAKKETPKPKGQPLFKDNATMIALLRDVWSSGK